MKHAFHYLRYLLLLVGFAITTLCLSPSIAQSQTGEAWTWGRNLYSQLGDGTSEDRNAPVSPSNLKGVVQVSGGYSYSLALKSDGTVWGWGDNSYGQLGDGTKNRANSPIQTPDIADVTQIATGYGHSLALKSDGTVWAWGYNSTGSVGDGTREDRTVPVQVSGLASVVQIAAGSIHSLALKSDGTVWVWGYNNDGELGLGNFLSRDKPTQVSSLANVSQIATGFWHSFAIKSDGTVWAWGYNVYGQHGDGTTKNRATPAQISELTGVAQIAASSLHTLALKSDGTVWACGGNSYGQLGDGTLQGKTRPIQLSGISGVIRLAAGGDGYSGHSIAQKSDGTVWAWGAGGYGQMGDGANEHRSLPAPVLGLRKTTQIACGWLHNLAIGTLKTLGTKTVASNITLVYGQVVLVATLKDSEGGLLANQPLSFTLNGNDVGAAKTNASGKASLLIAGSTDYTVGSYPFTVSFEGNAFYTPSTASASLIIKRADTITTVNGISGSPGETKYLVATLTRKTNNTLVVGQPVEFKLDGISIGTATTDGTGVASLPYDFDDATAENRVLSAKFTGDANQYGSSGTAPLTTTTAATTITANSASGRIGQTVNFVATLTRNTDNKGVARREVVFKIAGIPVGTAMTDNGGVATLPYKIEESAGIGRVALSAEFAGDSLYLPSINIKQRSLTVSKAKTKITARNVNGRKDATVSLSATLIRTTDKATLAGKPVRFQIDGVDVGAVATDSNGVANLNYLIPKTLESGKHAITLTFEEDASYLGYSANGVSINVK